MKHVILRIELDGETVLIGLHAGGDFRLKPTQDLKLQLIMN